MEIARENLATFSTRQNIHKKNKFEEDHFLKNYIQDSIRQEAKDRNKAYTIHKLKEIEVKNYNRNTMSFIG